MPKVFADSGKRNNRVNPATRNTATRAIRRAGLPLALLCGAAAIIGGLHAAGLRLNVSTSEPVGFYRMRKFDPAARLHHGDLVEFCPRVSPQNYPFILRGHCPGGAMPFLKQVIGIPGDVITETDEGVFINGNPVPLSQPLARSKAGQVNLPGWRGQTRLGQGEYWVYGSGNARNSFDSRYYGPVETAEIISVAISE